MQFHTSASRASDGSPTLPRLGEATHTWGALGLGAGGWGPVRAGACVLLLGARLFLAICLWFPSTKGSEEPIPLLAQTWRRAATVQRGSEPHAGGPGA